MNSAKGKWRRRDFMRAMTAVACAIAGAAARAAPLVPPVLRVLAPAAGAVGEPRDISVTIANGGTAPVLVLPNMIRLRIEGIGAEYIPYPGPPIDPWGFARVLAPGENAAIRFRNASDKRGVWRLPPGNYRVVAIYEVPPDLAPPPTVDSRRVWRGRLESPPLAMTFN